jgi:gamma-glutamyltranspeptidase/glutathione hydrolase
MDLDSAGKVTDKRLVGHLATGVPGSVAGMHAAWKRFGKLPWATVLAPAIRLAEGHVIDTARSRDINYERETLARFPASRAQFLVNDSAPPPGTMWRQPDLARTLRLISDSGPDVFYRGQIADLIVAEMQRGGGLITKDDLRRYQAKWRDPVRLTYRGYTIFSMAPPSSGGVTMGELLNILEDIPPSRRSGRRSTCTSSRRRCARVHRPQSLSGDPISCRCRLDRLLSRNRMRDATRQIDPSARPTPPLGASGGEPMETTHASIVDANSDAVAVTTTTLNGGFGSGVAVTGRGIPAQQRDGRFHAPHRGSPTCSGSSG